MTDCKVHMAGKSKNKINGWRSYWVGSVATLHETSLDVMFFLFLFCFLDVCMGTSSSSGSSSSSRGGTLCGSGQKGSNL